MRRQDIAWSDVVEEHGALRATAVAALLIASTLGAATWTAGAALLIWPHAGLITTAVITGDLAQQWWDTRDDRRILRAWHRACEDIGMLNVPTIRRRPDGRLDYRISAASITLQVQVHPPRASRQPAPEPPKKQEGDNGEAKREQQGGPKGTAITTLSQLAAHEEALKVMMGEHGATDVARVEVHAGHGNHATVVITVDVPGARRRTVLVTGPDDELVRISVLSRSPGAGWVWSDALCGYVVAKHAHSQPADLPPWASADDHWELDDDEYHGYDLRTTRAMPRSDPLLGDEKPQVDPRDAQRLGPGGGEELTTPLPGVEFAGWAPPDLATREAWTS